MNQINVILGAIIVVLISIVMIGCSKKNTPSQSEDGEESGAELALNETYDRVRNGARLILTYDAQDNSFKGTVENTTNEALKQVRVEVHLSNGKELGPTTPGDLAPGEKREILLAATSTNFDGWTAHPEVGESEHSHEGEGGEHGKEGEGEHGRGEEGGEHGREGESEHN
ncbi:hypothetical protein C6503_14195 [Candidatus Poribacteria bacterium]|nr:MAG: hypothetical protein C6503_14195 [Candidatus Poribacteria bacterium]